jgi:hypothetical protein
MMINTNQSVTKLARIRLANSSEFGGVVCESVVVKAIGWVEKVQGLVEIGTGRLVNDSSDSTVPLLRYRSWHQSK